MQLLLLVQQRQALMPASEPHPLDIILLDLPADFQERDETPFYTVSPMPVPW